MKKDLAIILGLFLLIAVLIIFGRGLTSIDFGQKNSGNLTFLTGTSQKTVTVTARTLRVDAIIASTIDERKRGLSKRDSLPLTSGVLFVFEKPGEYGIWMKDMKFAIDILWIGEDKMILAIQRNAPPEPNKKDRELTIYNPKVAARFVLEVNAGLVDLNGINVGDKASFELPK